MAAKVEARDVWKSYPVPRGVLCAVQGVSLAIGEGEFVALVGPSGCGKSTLLNVLAGFERPDRGAVLVDGRPVEGPSRRGIVITQRGSIFPWMTVRENLLFGAGDGDPDERERLAGRHVELVGLAGFEGAYPHQLSGGMLQRVEVARALMAKPDVLYMDEPFGALDALTRMRMRHELLRILLRDRHTCLLVTHDVEEALHLADRVLVMSPRPGRITCAVELDFPYPRAMSSPELVALKERILGELGLTTGEIGAETAAASGAATGVLQDPSPAPTRGAVARGIRSGRPGRRA